MFIKSLVDLYEKLAAAGLVPKDGYTEVKISGKIILNDNGDIVDIEFHDKKEPAERLLVPYQPTRSNGKKPYFLCDNPKYMLGITEDPGYFSSARTLHLEKLEGVKCPAGQVLYRYFQKNKNGCPLPDKFKDDKDLNKKLEKASSMVFVHNGEYIMRQLELEQIAVDIFLNQEGRMYCRDAITGKAGVFAPVHQKIKGVPGARPTGGSLISYKPVAFQSYGKKNGENILMTEHTQFAYTTALNYLLMDREHHLTFKNGSIVFWSDAPGMDPFAKELIGGFAKTEEPMYQIMTSLLHGEMPQTSLPDRYYIAGLRGNAGRVSVSFFYQDTLNGLMGRVSNHLLRMKMDSDLRIPSVTQILLEIERSGTKVSELNEEQVEAFLTAVLYDQKYPDPIYQRVLNQIRVNNAVNFRKASFIQAYLTKNCLKEGDNMEKEKAYKMGTLFSLLEQTQEEAARLINTPLGRSFRDRFFGRAMTQPGMVFPVMFRLNVHHKNKLFRVSPGYANSLDRAVTDLAVEIGVIPMQLSLADRGLFSLGYFNARQKRFERFESKEK